MHTRFLQEPSSRRYSVDRLSRFNAWMSVSHNMTEITLTCILSFDVSGMSYERSCLFHNEFIILKPSALLNASNCEAVCRKSKQTVIKLAAAPSMTKNHQAVNNHIKVSTSAIAGPARRTPRTILIPEKVIFWCVSFAIARALPTTFLI